MKHLDKANMTYFQHLKIALWYFWWLGLATIALLIHAFCPWWFETTASNIIKNVYFKFMKHQHRDYSWINTQKYSEFKTNLIKILNLAELNYKGMSEEELQCCRFISAHIQHGKDV